MTDPTMGLHGVEKEKGQVNHKANCTCFFYSKFKHVLRKINQLQLGKLYRAGQKSPAFKTVSDSIQKVSDDNSHSCLIHHLSPQVPRSEPEERKTVEREGATMYTVDPTRKVMYYSDGRSITREPFNYPG